MEYKICENRIYVEDNAKDIVAEICFEENNNVYNIYHTYVADKFRGQGIASKLMEYAIKEIKSRGGKVTATCSFAKKYIKEKENGKKDSR